MRLRIRQIIAFGLFVLFAVNTHAAPNSALQEGKAAAARGDLVGAISSWNQVISEPDSPLVYLEALIRRGEAYRVLGHYHVAKADLEEAQTNAHKTGNLMLEVVATQALGHLYFQQRDFSLAEDLLHTSCKQARQLELFDVAAVSGNMLGSIEFERGQKEKAEASFRDALSLAQRSNDHGLIAAVHRNLARLVGNEDAALHELRVAREAVGSVEEPYERAELLLGIAVEAQKSVKGDAGVGFAHEALREVERIADDLDNPRLQSLVAGYLASLYKQQGRPVEARVLYERAIRRAQPIAAHELLMEWEWQLGRLLRAQDDHTRAIEAFRRAAYHLQSIRQDIPIEYHNGRSSFRETWAPIYFGLADLLLQEASVVVDKDTKQQLLHEARDAVERIKVSEMRDYLRDPCIVARTEKIESLSPKTAVFYPVSFDDRLELLVGIGERLHRVSVDVSSKELADIVKVLVQNLHEGSFVKRAAMDLYDLLIQPIVPLLDKYQVDTLVFVPYGALQALPISALWDGKRFLVEHYAIATVAGLTLLQPGHREHTKMKALLAGLSRPGPVVLNLPSAVVGSLLAERGIEPKNRRRGLPVTDLQLQTRAFSQSELKERGITQSELAEQLKLEKVPEEIGRLAQRFEGEVLLDDKFILQRFETEFLNQPYRIVHIASHGFFGGTPEQNFILTYDKKLSMDQLAELLKPKQLVEQPVELLGLSACQTAEGDDRTPLGLSGVAVKSGARSVLGSLWPVYDSVALQLIPSFYDYLIQPKMTKAKALQRAQLDLLERGEFHDPIYWAPFILVGNWL